MKLRVAAVLFLSASLLACAAGEKSSSPIPATPLADSTKAQETAEGVFVRIDEGDYFHFVLKDKQGEEQSFFILKPDASLEKVTDSPGDYVGRKCRITYRESEEFLLEAGQKLKIRQILSVKWLP